MPAERFYLNADYARGTSVCLKGNEHHHLAHVMRLKTGEEVELVNGRGGLGRARIADTDKQLTTLEILHETDTTPSPATWIIAVPLMRPAKLEWIIEKGTELGADSFWLYRADHSEKESLSEHQIDRLRHLTISALKQSRRLFLPSIEILPGVPSLLSHEGPILFGDLRPTAPPISNIPAGASILFVSGPERGFSQDEIHLLDQKGRGVRLNPNILRAETAPIAAISILRSSSI